MMKNKLFSFLIALSVVTSVFIVSVVVNDFVINAKWVTSEARQEYGVWAEGVSVAEAPFGVDADFLCFNYCSRTTTGVYYHRFFRYIKFDSDFKNSTLPHELSHHFWFTKMSESERESWCSNFNWTSWSYDGSCKEAFAEWLGVYVQASSIWDDKLSILNISNGTFTNGKFNYVANKDLEKKVKELKAKGVKV